MAYFTNHKVYIPKFTTPEVAGITYGGFEACKYILSQPNATPADGSPDVAHSGAAAAVPGISRAGLPVWDYIAFPQSMIACCNMGKGWHLTSAFERAALAFLSQKYNTMPHGGNKNVNPPTDYTFTSEIGMLDKHLFVESSGSYMRALPGTGPNTWAHNHMASGVYDLNGLVWEWILMMMSTDGYARVQGNLDVTYTGSPYGRGTISGSGTATPTLTCDGTGINWLKQWTVDEFNGMKCYIAEASGGAGVLYDITDTTATTIVLTDGDAPGNGAATFSIFKTITTDITTGMSTGNKILTLRNSDADLKAFAIPATSDATGSAVYGNDIFYFDKSAERAAVWGGSFVDGADAGVFALGLNDAPSGASGAIGFRACKAL